MYNRNFFNELKKVSEAGRLSAGLSILCLIKFSRGYNLTISKNPSR